jgi:glycosyltransferase involved in cell wall biosynthesis
MKILHVTPAYEGAWHLGGVVRAVSQLCRGLARLGHDVTVFTTDSGLNTADHIPVDQPVTAGGVKVFYFKTDFLPNFGYSKSLRQACLRYIRDFDIVHLSSLWWYTEIVATAAARQYGVPYIMSPTGGLTEYSLSQSRFKKELYLRIFGRRIFNGAKAIHFTAALEREQSAPMHLAIPSFIVPNGFDIDEFKESPDKVRARKEMGFPADHFIILFLGRLHAVKNLDMLIKAFAELVKKIPNVSLALAGPDDGQQVSLQELAAQLGVAANVFFPGVISPEKRNTILRAADVFALISWHENFGNVAAEAMFMGVPVLLSEKVGICREVMASGAGKVVSLNEQVIAQGLEQMLNDPEGLKAMGKVALEFARHHYEINIVTEMMSQAYEDVIAGIQHSELSWQLFANMKN